MDFAPSEAALRVQQVARDMAAQVIAPIASDLDATGRFPTDVVARLGELGLMAVAVPRRLGGTEAGSVGYALAIEELARACASTAVLASVTNMVCETIARFGTDEQASRYCARLAAGVDGVGSFALSEPGAGSDPGALQTTARRDGSGWVLDGVKQWTTGGSHAAVLIVWARTAPPETGHRGISCFLVERGQAGMTVGRPEDKMGIVASHTTPITFDACRLPANALLGQHNGGFKIAMTALDGGRIGIGAQAVGIARAALEASLDWAARRRAAGALVEGEQGYAFEVADMRAQIDAAALLVLRAAWLKERGAPFGRESAMAKLAASETAVQVCNRAVLLRGIEGYVRGEVERHLRDARVTMLYEGTSEIQRLVIARHVLA